MSDDLIEQKLVPDCMSDEGAKPCKGYANLMKAAIQTRTRLESENTYLRKIADMAAKQRDEALEALETAEADALEKAASEIINDVLQKQCPEAGKTRMKMMKATMRMNVPGLTRTIRWQIVNYAIRALKPKAKA